MCLKTRARLYFQEITFGISRIILFQNLAIALYESLKTKTKQNKNKKKQRYFKNATCGTKSAHYSKYYNLCNYVWPFGRIRLVVPSILHPYDLFATKKY